MKYNTIELGDMIACFPIDKKSGAAGLWLYPAGKKNKLVPRRDIVDDFTIRNLRIKNHRAWQVESLVQFKLREDDHAIDHVMGKSLRNSPSLADLKFKEQTVLKKNGNTEVITSLARPDGIAVDHHILHEKGEPWIRTKSVFHNRSKKHVTLELLSSFSLSGLSPFDKSESIERLFLHRFRSYWSAEGRHDCQSIESLNLERSWVGCGVRNERFGQCGSMPVNTFFPTMAIEDRKAGVFWGAALEWAGSWQMECYRVDDQLSVSGGLVEMY